MGTQDLYATFSQIYTMVSWNIADIYKNCYYSGKIERGFK